MPRTLTHTRKFRVYIVCTRDMHDARPNSSFYMQGRWSHCYCSCRSSGLDLKLAF